MLLLPPLIPQKPATSSPRKTCLNGWTLHLALVVDDDAGIVLEPNHKWISVPLDVSSHRTSVLNPSSVEIHDEILFLDECPNSSEAHCCWWYSRKYVLKSVFYYLYIYTLHAEWAQAQGNTHSPESFHRNVFDAFTKYGSMQQYAKSNPFGTHPIFPMKWP